MEKIIDEHWMNLALIEAQLAWDHGDVPVGAVIVDKHNSLLAVGRNLRELQNDPTAHAEIVALRMAAKKQESWRLEGCTLYVTLEPCFMCAGAIVNSRLRRVVFGASDPKAGAVTSLAQCLNDPRLNHSSEVTSGILKTECSKILKDFFRARRGT